MKIYIKREPFKITRAGLSMHCGVSFLKRYTGCADVPDLQATTRQWTGNKIACLHIHRYLWGTPDIVILNQSCLCCLVLRHKLWKRTSGFARSSSTAQFSYVNYLPPSGLCTKTLWNTQMKLPIVFEFIIYIKSFSTLLIQNTQQHPSFTVC